MSKLKRILSLALVIVMILTMAAGCKKEGGNDAQSATEASGNASSDGASVTYTVSVKTQGGMAMSDLKVYVYADDTLADMKQAGQTDENGTCSFTMPQNSQYAVAISGAPKGYQVEKSYSFAGNTAAITLSSQLVSDQTLDEVAASGNSLAVGDVMRDFSVTTPAGETVSLSQMLQEKEVILVNFWYTTCSWCIKEFPYMQETYSQYSDKVGVIALNYFGDSDNEIAAFQQSYGLEFPMAACPSVWATACGISGAPHTLVIDRYGVICHMESGALIGKRPFLSLFETFTGDDYVQKLYSSMDEIVITPTPTYTMDTPENVAALLNQGEIEISYRGDDGEYTWPFIATEKLGEPCMMASNQDVDESYAILCADVTLKAGQALAFDYLISSEAGSDIFHVIVDDVPIYTISGANEEEVWECCYPWVAEQDGTYSVVLAYIKDSSDFAGDDTAYIKNFRIVDTAQIDVPTYLPRFAAVETEEGFEYVDIVYSQKDGYYHVGTADGPLLLADLMNTTQFNEEETVWDMVNGGQIVKDGKDYYDELVDYCSYASNSSLSGICTVNQELYELLQIVGEVAGYDENDPNEWLKVCKYYQAYGSNGEQLQDPIKGLAPFCAPEAKEGKNIATNVFTYDRVIMPRGTVMKFVPTRSGAYRISTHCDDGKQLEAWIFEGDMDDVEYPDYVYEPSERLVEDTENIYMVYYMEKGKTYYIDICYWDLYETGSIPFDIEFMGSSYTVFRTCAPGYFTYDTNATGDAMYHLIALGIDIVLGSDGYYYEDLGGGKKGSAIYVDFTGINGIFGEPILTVPAYNDDGSIMKDSDGNPVMITGLIDKGGFNFVMNENDAFIQFYIDKHDGDIEATDKYLRELWGESYDSYAEIYMIDDVYEGIYHGTGEDLTEEVRAYADKVISGKSEEINGCVKVDERLAEILQLLMDNYSFSGVDNSWLKICYYYDTYSANG